MPSRILKPLTSLVEELKRDLKNLGLSGKCKIFNNKNDRLGFVISHISKPELIGNMIALLSRNPQALELPPSSEPEINELTKELLRFECEIMDAGYIKYGTQSYHDDRVISFALSLWGHRRKPWYKPDVKFFDYGFSKSARTQDKFEFNLTEDYEIQMVELMEAL